MSEQRRRRQSPRRNVLWILGVVLPLAFLVHRAAFSNAFLDFDDPINIVNNDAIRTMSAESVRTYFTRPLMGMYSPLVYASYAVDYRVGGLDVTTYHTTNLLLHLASICVVCLVVMRLTGNVAASAVATMLFAVHPVNVAAVAPLSVRSSLLYSFFYLCAYLAYLSYARTQKTGRLVLCFALFLCALLSKVSAVVFPVLLLLTDYVEQRAWSRKVAIEKLPFFLASAIFGVVALGIRPDMAAMKGSLLDYSMLERLCLAAYSLLAYLQRMLAPVGLSPIYPYLPRVNGHFPWQVYVAPVVLLAGVLLATRLRSHRRLLVFGAGFFVLHLVLVLKVVPLGVELMADRYLYLPGIGLFVMAGELVREASPQIRRVSLAAFAVIVVCFSIMSYARYADWRDSITFYSRAIDRYPASAVAHNNLGGAFEDAHRAGDAFVEYQAAVRLEPGYVPPHVNLGNALLKQGRPSEAASEFIEALRLEPDNAKAHAGLGAALARLGRPRDAIAHFTESVRLDPAVAETHSNLGVVLDSQGRVADAIAQYTSALALDPNLVDAHNNLGAALASQGQIDDARVHFVEALRLDPHFVEAHYNLAMVLARTGDRAGAIQHLEAALARAPNHEGARRLLDELRR